MNALTKPTTTLPASAGPQGPAVASAPQPPAYRADFRGPILAGWVVLAVVLGSFGAWAGLAPLSTGVIAHGTVVVDSKRKTLQHLEGGIVKEILVRDGDEVQAGQVLLRLDETQVQASLNLMLGRLDAALAERARLVAERSGADTVAFPPALLERARSSPETAELLAAQEGLFAARRDTFAGQVEVLENRIQQSLSQIEGLERQVTSKDQQMELLRQELAGKNELAGKGFAPKTQILALERDLARLEGERGEAMAQIAAVRQAVNEARLQILNLRTDFREKTETQLAEAEQKVFDLTERVAAIRDQRGRLEVVAPVSGVVVDLAAHTVGGVISPGAKIMEIVPKNDALVIEAQMLPDNIDDVRSGMTADIVFSAFDRNTTPTVKGHVLNVSADRLTDPRTQAAYYLVRLEVDDAGREALAGLELVPGMPAEVMINKDQRTLVDMIVQPFRDVMNRALRE